MSKNGLPRPLGELEETIGYHFKDQELLRHALLHSSAANELGMGHSGSNERLEFLGDAVLELISSEYLYQSFPKLPEGELTRNRAGLVCEPALAHCAAKIALGEFLILGKGEEQTGGRRRDSVTSDAMEAVIGAIYLDGGLESARNFVNRYVLKAQEGRTYFSDSKTSLQELVQHQGLGRIVYSLLEEKGPAHEREYTVECRVGDKIRETGDGHTKKSAEQEAARKILEQLFADRG